MYWTVIVPLVSRKCMQEADYRLLLNLDGYMKEYGHQRYILQVEGRRYAQSYVPLEQDVASYRQTWEYP